MAKARPSGITLTRSDVAKILAMVARGDRRHDIAAWFGLNQGRIKEVEDGDYGKPPIAPANEIPPSGSPGPKARELRVAAEKVYSLLTTNGAAGVNTAISELSQAITRFERDV
jgi:hypothetical protein